MAEAINAGPYDVVFSEQDQFTMTPFLFRYLEKPTVYYCQQPSRGQDAVLTDASRSALLTAPVPVWKKAWRTHLRRNIPKIDRENASYAKYILANSYFSRETILRAYGVNSYVSYMGIDAELFRPLWSQKENFVLSVGGVPAPQGIRLYDSISEPYR